MFSLTKILRTRRRLYGNLPCSLLLLLHLFSILEIQGVSRQVKLERSVAQVICQQSQVFAQTGGQFQPPMHAKPSHFMDGPCGFYQFGRCDEYRCHFVGFVPCGSRQSFDLPPPPAVPVPVPEPVVPVIERESDIPSSFEEESPLQLGPGLKLKINIDPRDEGSVLPWKNTPTEGKSPGRESESPAKVGPGGRIVGGKNAKPHSYPFILAVYIDGDLQCGASILSKDWVLGAAHCLVGDTYEFVAGDHKISKKEGTEQTVKAIKIIKHEKYDEKPNTDMNDIALFKVSPPFKFNKNVQPVKLPKKKEKLKKGLVTVAGWGLHKSDKEGGEPQDILQEVDLPIISHQTCKKKYAKSLILETMMCTLNANGGKDACQGDSGGPAFSMKGGKITQVGIVSWGIGCAKKDKPGVYTEVSFYLDWIRKKTGLKL